MLVAPQMVGQVRRRLGTTVEEDASRREHQGVLRERHERAAAEKLQLEHKVRAGSRARCQGAGQQQQQQHQQQQQKQQRQQQVGAGSYPPAGGGR
jgi:hypothetical protein